MKRNYLLILLVSFSINIISCFNSKNIPKITEKTCLVLSVGGLRGFAHIGAIKALKELNVKIDYIYGNSMGSVIGGIYAFNPDGNIKRDVKRIYDQYENETIREKKAKATSGFIFGAVLAFFSGGLLGWETMLGSSFINYASVEEFDNNRFQYILDRQFNSISIEELSIPFATSYQTHNNDGLSLSIISKGNLSTAISRSSNNPFIFKNTDLQYIDPGSDRMAAVPISDAIKHFNPTRIIAINVTGEPAIYSLEKNINVIEVLIDFDYDESESIENLFTDYVDMGYRAVIEKLK